MVVFLIHVLAHDTNFPPEGCQDEEIYARFCSPLVFALQAVVNASFVGGDMEFVNDAVSYLRGIFHAIKRAEDAVDALTTPKLHILADFGMSILTALGYSSSSMPRTMGPILLPSSLYKISLAEKREANLNSLSQSGFGKNITKKLVQRFESEISHTASIVTKRGHRSRDDSSHSDAVALSKGVWSMDGKRDQTHQSKISYARGTELHEIRKQEINNGEKQNPAPSSCSSRSVELHKEFSIEDEHEKAASGNSDLIIRNEQLPLSCDFVTKKTSQPHKDELLHSNPLKENEAIIQCNGITEKPSKRSRANLSSLCHSQRIGSGIESLLGRRIKLWSPIDKCYYAGTVDSFDSRNNTHKINYDSGEVEVVSLNSEKWEALNNDLLLDKVIQTKLPKYYFQILEHKSRLGVVFLESAIISENAHPSMDIISEMDCMLHCIGCISNVVLNTKLGKRYDIGVK
ncbi:unnamed protein product [Ilex paraguariensis]|uniref:Uncharacterized protein n=1 Tax=Ilex paraguariensis TaxID=185542 RepID=A0ABC8RK64_9AQUA